MFARVHRGSLALAALLLAVALRVDAAPGDLKSFTADLKKAVGAQNHDQIQAALEGLLDCGGAAACGEVVDIIPKLTKAQDDTYWQLVSAAAGFRDGPAQNNASPHTVNALQQVLEKGPYDLQLMAADQLAKVKTTESVDALIGQLKKEGDKGDPELKRRLMTALAAVTGEQMGDAVNWTGWWDANRNKGLPDKGDDSHQGSLASQTLDPNRKKDFESMTKDPRRVVVITARLSADHPKEPNKDYNYDHMESILTEMKIAHTVVSKDKFEAEPRKYLEHAWTVLVNCNNIQTQCICADCIRILGEKKAKGQNVGGTNNRLYSCPPECPKHDQVSYKLKPESINAIKAWVEQGGYLFTEDWGVVEILEVAWPDLVKNSKETKLPDGSKKQEFNLIRTTDVTITPGRGLTSLPLMRGVFARPRPAAKKEEGGDDAAGGTKTRDLPENPTTPPKHQWHIDDESPAIEVPPTGKDKVTVLIESEDLAKLSGGNESVAISFRYGNNPPKKAEPEGGKPRVRTGEGGGGGGGGSSRARGEWAETLKGGCVLHCMSHFGKQQSRKEDTFVVQNLILNFIMESNRQHQ
jgi:hypothetical protein